MSLVPCPSCGSTVSHLAEECVHCGYDLVVVPAAAVSARPRRVRRGKLVLAGLAGAVLVLAVLATFASMASPRLHSFAAAASAGGDVGDDAVAALSAILELQHEHFAHHGAYTFNLFDPAGADYLEGWDPALAPAGYDLLVLEADAADLCVQARPTPGTAAGAITIDEQGTIRDGDGCTGPVALAPPLVES